MKDATATGRRKRKRKAWDEIEIDRAVRLGLLEFLPETEITIRLVRVPTVRRNRQTQHEKDLTSEARAELDRALSALNGQTWSAEIGNPFDHLPFGTGALLNPGAF